MKVLLNSHSIRNCLKNLPGGSGKVRAHISSPTIYCFPNNQDQNPPSCWTIRCLEKLNLFGFFPSIERYLNAYPFSFFSGLIAKVNSFSIFTWPSTLSFLNRSKQAMQSRVFSQTSDNSGTHCYRWFEKSGLSETSISNNPRPLSQPFTTFTDPFYQFCGLLKLILENYLASCGHLGHIFDSNVHLCQKRQANGCPELMADHSRDSYPQMSVDEFSPVRGGRWITMDSCTLNKRPISLCRAIIDGHQDPLLFSVNQTYHNFKQDRRYYFSFSADRADEIVECFISAADTGGPEPTGDCFSAFGEDDSSDDYAQPPGRALMQDAAKSNNPDLPVIRENPFIKHRLTFANVCFVSNTSARMSHFYEISFVKELKSSSFSWKVQN